MSGASGVDTGARHGDLELAFEALCGRAVDGAERGGEGADEVACQRMFDVGRVERRHRRRAGAAFVNHVRELLVASRAARGRVLPDRFQRDYGSSGGRPRPAHL
jgi:hypothetical protein